MNDVNPLNNSNIAYLITWVQTRIDRARNDTEKSRGASAIEWAIITGILAIIAIAIGTIIYNKVKDSANRINTNPGLGK